MHSDLKQKDTAKESNASAPTLTAVRKKLELGRVMDCLGIGKCGQKRKTIPRLNQKINAVALGSRRTSCKELSMQLANDGIMVDRRTTNNRHFKQSLKPYRPRKKPRLTQKIKQARYQWDVQHEKLDIRRIVQRKLSINVKSDYRIAFLMLTMFF